MTLQDVHDRWSAIESGHLTKEGYVNATERLEKARYLAMQSIQFQELVQAWSNVLEAQERMDAQREAGTLPVDPHAIEPNPPGLPTQEEIEQIMKERAVKTQ